MNINQLKAFLGDKPLHLGKDNSLQNQLRDAGLEQAVRLQEKQNIQQTDKFSSSISFGAKVFANTLNASVEIDGRKPSLNTAEKTKPSKPLFDFEEVAKNVLKFVGGAIKSAKNNGADTERLNQLFDQATSGVLKGIKLAEKDLAGFMNDEIREGISQSKQLIQDGIEKLRQDIFPAETKSSNTESIAIASTLQVAVSQQQSGQLVIRTKEGDEVSLSFSDLRQIALQQAELVLDPNKQNAETRQPNNVNPDEPALASKQGQDVQAAGETSTVPTLSGEGEAELTKVDSPVENTQKMLEQKSVSFNESKLSFTLTGQLSEAELTSIGSLVSDINSLADEFFKGDIETAYQQALKLGFDDQELASFALQLTKVENIQVIKTYESVSHYDKGAGLNAPDKAVKPISHYLDKMLNVVEEARLKLQDGKDYENLVNELINRMGEVHTPDLIHAINRFHSFNQKLLDNLPLSLKP
ncbi:MAG: hypothetical protein GW763_06520 [Paraglaciecola sp.]|nr:hypothetical protein [Paraglaciecola sp.]NCT47638.1 hypothetical protein [Paraglaciecola sp.]